MQSTNQGKLSSAYKTRHVDVRKLPEANLQKYKQILKSDFGRTKLYLHNFEQWIDDCFQGWHRYCIVFGVRSKCSASASSVWNRLKCFCRCAFHFRDTWKKFGTFKSLSAAEQENLLALGEKKRLKWGSKWESLQCNVQCAKRSSYLIENGTKKTQNHWKNLKS